jgi:hypothetical protein
LVTQQKQKQKHHEIKAFKGEQGEEARNLAKHAGFALKRHKPFRDEQEGHGCGSSDLTSKMGKAKKATKKFLAKGAHDRERPHTSCYCVV